METHEQLQRLVDEYKIENDKFLNNNYSASKRARRCLLDIVRVCSIRRDEILEERKWIVSTYGEGNYVGEHARRMARKYGLKEGESYDWED